MLQGSGPTLREIDAGVNSTNNMHGLHFAHYTSWLEERGPRRFRFRRHCRCRPPPPPPRRCRPLCRRRRRRFVVVVLAVWMK